MKRARIGREGVSEYIIAYPYTDIKSKGDKNEKIFKISFWGRSGEHSRNAGGRSVAAKTTAAQEALHAP
jgi:hypothetical protein